MGLTGLPALCHLETTLLPLQSPLALRFWILGDFTGRDQSVKTCKREHLTPSNAEMFLCGCPCISERRTALRVTHGANQLQVAAVV